MLFHIQKKPQKQKRPSWWLVLHHVVFSWETMLVSQLESNSPTSGHSPCYFSAGPDLPLLFLPQQLNSRLSQTKSLSQDKLTSHNFCLDIEILLKSDGRHGKHAELQSRKAVSLKML